MKFYCMCKITGQGYAAKVVDNQVYLAPNRFIPGMPAETINDYMPVILKRSATCLQNGINQLVPNHNEDISNKHPKGIKQLREDGDRLRDSRRHYPNVDLYQCSRCGATFCVEG